YSRDLMGSLEGMQVPNTQEAAQLAAADDDIIADCGRDDVRAAVEKRKRIHGAEQSDAIFADIFQKVDAKKGRLRQVRAAPVATNTGLVADAEKYAEIVERERPNWSSDLKRIGLAALCVYRSRPVDVGTVQHVQMIWIILGGRLLRAHNGRAYFYDQRLGYFDVFDGLLPPELLFAASRFMLTLEGIFRDFPCGVERKDSAVLAAIDSAVENAVAKINGDISYAVKEAAALVSFRDNCVFNKGNAILQKAKGKGKGVAAQAPDGEGEGEGRGRGAEDAEGDDLTRASDAWHIAVAQTISKVSTKLQTELLSSKIMSYFIEWCSQDTMRSAGVAYEDCIVKYDVLGSPVTFSSERSPENSVYIGIRSQLLSTDPVLDAAVARVQKIYSQTFWSIPDAFVFGQAAQALAKRGYNVDTITVYWGPGGVGLSLLTSHLEAMYGHKNHKYFDPNVFFVDDELRKVVELLVDGFIFTGQERPSGQRGTMREDCGSGVKRTAAGILVTRAPTAEGRAARVVPFNVGDLLKKFATAEGVSGRLPYSILTKMFRIVGWKRLEVNKFLVFDEITEQNVESLMRRLAVVKIQARFFDRLYVEENFGDAAAAGIFARDPDAKEFLMSSVGVAAGHRVQFAFEDDHGAEACRDIIVRYARCGGDRGITEKSLRQACGLLEKTSNVAGSLQAEIDAPNSQGHGCTAPKEWLDFSMALIQECQKKNMDFLTLPAFKAMSLPTSCKLPAPKPKAFQRLQTEGLWVGIGTVGKAADRIAPRIRTKNGMSALIDESSMGACNYPEVYDMKSFRSVFFEHGARKTNAVVLADALGKGIRRPGRQAAEKAAREAAWSERAESVRRMESFIDTLASRDKRAQEIKRRRLTAKASGPSSQGESAHFDDEVSITVSTGYHHKVEWSRLFVDDSVGAQSMDQRLQKVLLTNTFDLDMENFLFCILPQMLKRLSLLDEKVFAEEFEVLNRLQKNRREVCEQELGVGLSVGKGILLEVACGASVPAAFRGNEFLAALSRASRMLRWLAVSLLPKVHLAMQQHEGKWAESSTFSYLWQGVENYILQHVLNFICEERVKHLSLHFDGVRVDVDRVAVTGSLGDFCSGCSARVHAATGYTVTLRNKEHSYFFDLLRAKSAAVVDEGGPRSNEDNKHLFLRGNCIPSAIAALTSQWAKARENISEPQDEVFRKYRDVAELLETPLFPRASLLDCKEGRYLLHAENGGLPHCIGAVIQNGSVVICEEGAARKMSVFDFEECYASALDMKMVVAFRLGDSIDPEESARLDGLLDLLAAGRWDDDGPTPPSRKRRRLASRAARAARGSPVSSSSPSPTPSARSAAPSNINSRRHNENLNFIELLRAKGLAVDDYDSGAPSSAGDQLLRRGNCIPCAFAAVTGQWQSVREKISGQQVADFRKYRDVAELLGTIFFPRASLQDCKEGRYLLHAEHDGLPHCVGAVFQHGEVVIFEKGKAQKMSVSAFEECYASALDIKTVVAFCLDEDGIDDGESSRLDGLLDLLAAGDDEGSEASCDGESFDGGTVDVHSELLRALKAEVDAAKAAVRGGSQSRCILCPFKEFDESSPKVKRNLLTHLCNYHNPERKSQRTGDRQMGFGNYVASGTKQMKMVFAMFDSDRCQGKSQGRYLERTAQMLRESVKPALACLRIDRDIRLLLDGAGPIFINAAAIMSEPPEGPTTLARRVGDTYYSHAFAEIIFKEFMLNHGRARPTRARIVARCAEAGSQLTHLLPQEVTKWLELLEDLLSAPFVRAARDQLMQQLLDHDEFVHVSIDATIRAAMRIKGQANYRDSAEKRAAAPFDDTVAKRRILTVRGRTAAVAGMWPIASEAARNIKDMLQMRLPQAALDQCRSIATDDPSGELYGQLLEICKNLTWLSLDPVHLAIVYNSAHWPGQTALRTVLNKFNKIDYQATSDAWGPAYTGGQLQPLTPDQNRSRGAVKNGSMPRREAQRLLDNLNGEEPFKNTDDFVRAMAAITSVYWDEVNRGTASGRLLVDVLWSATSVERVQFLFNNTRMRHSLPKKYQSLIGSGTSPNEALHAEVNRWFRNQPELYLETLELQLAAATHAKLIAHNAAMYAPALRALTSQTVLATAIGRQLASPDEWQRFCAAQASGVGAPAKACLPKSAQRKASQPLAKQWAKDRKNFKSIVRKRPAAMKAAQKRPAAMKGVKRTPFNRKRVIR
ncbi:unnamed protein product, partial [Prorocentrum cordatum]